MDPQRRVLGRAILRGCAVGLLLTVGAEAARVLVGGNFHAVLPGRAYRCSQPSADRLERLIRQHGIRTVINLRGNSDPSEWYLAECRVTGRLNVSQEDVRFSAGRLPSVHEVRRLVEVLDKSDYPVLFHCQRGADRTGLASAVLLLLHTDLALDEACRQLGPRYGHVALGRPANLDRFLDLYVDWLKDRGRGHSRAAFRQWVTSEYCGGPCRCRVEVLERPAPVRVGEPSAWRVRVHNTSVGAWRLRQGSGAGFHACYTVSGPDNRMLVKERAGLFDAVVPPGGFIDLTLAVPSLPRPGKYNLMVDMMEEQHCLFYQVGSDPLEQEFEVRE